MDKNPLLLKRLRQFILLYNFTKKWGVDVAYIKIMESLFQSKATKINIMPLKYPFDTDRTLEWKVRLEERLRSNNIIYMFERAD